MAFKREAVIKAAEKYVARGKIEAAIREYRKVLEDNPNDTSTLNRVGDLYARIERFDEAVRLFTQIAEHYTTDGFFVKAIAIYKKIIKLDPTALRVYEKLAALYAKQGLITEARTQYQVLADYYQKHDNAASAITIYQRMAELEPDNPSFRLKLADLYTSRRLTDKAMHELRLLAEIFVRSGSLEEAAQVYVRAIDTNPEDLAFVEQAVGDLQQRGSTEGAVRVLTRAVEQNPEAASIARRLGVALPGMELPEADEVAEPAASREPESERISLDEVALETPGSLDEDELDIELAESSTLDMGDLGSVDDGLDDAFADAAPTHASGTFHFDLEDDEEPASLVQPPADMLDDALAAAADAVDDQPAMQESEVFELVLGDLDDDLTDESTVVPEPDAEWEPASEAPAEEDDGGPASETVSQVVARAMSEVVDAAEAPKAPDAAADDDEPIEIEIDWEFDGLDEEPVLAPEREVTAAGPPEEDPSLDDTIIPTFEAEGADDDVIDLGEIDVEPPAEEVVTEASKVEGDADDAMPEFELELDLDDEDELAAAAPSVDESALEVPALDDLDATIPAATTPPSVAPPAAAPLDLEATVATSPPPASAAVVSPPTVSAVHRQDDLYAEAQVFAKYGLRNKAEERLAALHEHNPQHLGGWLLVARMCLEAGETTSVIEHANRVSSLAMAVGEPGAWAQLRQELEYAGYGFDGDQVVAEPKPKAEKKRENRISQFLEMLDTSTDASPAEKPAAVEPPPAAPAAPAAPVEVSEAEPEVSTPSDDEAPVDGQDEVMAAAVAEADRQAAEEAIVAPDTIEVDDDVEDALADLVPTTPPPPARKVNLVEELGLDEGPAPTPAADAFDDTGMSWLDDTRVPSAEPETEQALFDEEDDFFDLAAELERELTEDEMAEGVSPASQAEGQSLEEIVEGFKKGVAENLSPEDFDTHFNLGIAYREMGLLDEAIGEFQLASKDARYLVESSSMLGMCFLDKGLPELAIKWYRKGLASPAIREDESLGLLYEMADVYERTGDTEAARKTFVEIYGMDTNFRDVADRLKALDAAD